MKSSSALLLIITLGLSGCATGYQAMQRGDYDKATSLSAQHLKNFPHSRKATEVLVRSYPEAKERLLNKAHYAQIATSDPFRWEAAVDAYRVLNKLAKQIDKAPEDVSSMINYDFFHDELNESLWNASVARVEIGNGLLANGERKEARDAYFHFEKALGYTPGLANIEAKKAKALEAGTIRIAIASLGYGPRYGLDPELLESKLLGRIGGRSIGTFIDVVPYNYEYRNESFALDHILNLSISRSAIGMVSETSTRHHYHKEIEIGRKEGHPEELIIKTVSASVTEFYREKRSEASVDYWITGYQNNEDVFANTAHSRATWNDTWLQVEGDLRAAPNGYVSTYCEVEPSNWQQEDQVANELVRRIASQLKKFYHEF